MITGEQVKALRKHLGESQTQFASRFHVDQATVHRWEAKGVPDRGTAEVAVDRLLKEVEAGSEAPQ